MTLNLIRRFPNVPPANHTGNGSKDDQTGKKPGQPVKSKVGRFRFSAA